MRAVTQVFTPSVISSPHTRQIAFWRINPIVFPLNSIPSANFYPCVLVTFSLLRRTTVTTLLKDTKLNQSTNCRLVQNPGEMFQHIRSTA